MVTQLRNLIVRAVGDISNLFLEATVRGEGTAMCLKPINKTFKKLLIPIQLYLVILFCPDLNHASTSVKSRILLQGAHS